MDGTCWLQEAPAIPVEDVANKARSQPPNVVQKLKDDNNEDGDCVTYLSEEPSGPFSGASKVLESFDIICGGRLRGVLEVSQRCLRCDLPCPQQQCMVALTMTMPSPFFRDVQK